MTLRLVNLRLIQLALLPLLVPFTGLSAATVVIGLGLYALTILVRALLDGLRSVPDDVREAARGLGYGNARMLTRIEMPLALPVAMAGLRVAALSVLARRDGDRFGEKLAWAQRDLRGARAGLKPKCELLKAR